MTAKPARLAVIILLTCVCSCQSNAKKHGNIQVPDAGQGVMSGAKELSAEDIDGIVQNVASPVEIASMLQSLSVPFSAEYLGSTKGVSQISSNFQKATMLGIYGADLGYLNIYEKTNNSLDIVSSIKRLADELNVGQLFDSETIKRLSLNKSGIDSLLFISVNSYNRMDEYLRSNNKGSLSALMITGVWLEGQYLVTQVVTNYPEKSLKDRIGEQKIILNDILRLLKPYKDTSKEYSSLYAMMEQLGRQYREIRINYTIADPQTEEKDGRLVLVQKEESVVDMNDEQLEKIVGLTMNIRNKLISGE